MMKHRFNGKRGLAFISIVLCALLAVGIFGASGCAKKSGGTGAEFWSASVNVKVNKDLNDYDSVKRKPEINLTMAQGEYESAQIIFTPEKDVKAYTVTVSDLKNVTTGDIFSKDRIRVYKQEYVYLATIHQTVDGAIPSYFPDALIPMDAVVKYGENTVKAGENQGVNFRFSTRPELDENGDAIVKDDAKTKDSERFSYVPAGVYTGQVVFDLDGKKTVISVRLEIVNATVSETNHVKSYFAVWPTALVADMNYTQEGFDSYTDLMLEYRISNKRLFNDNPVSYKLLPDFTDALCERLKDPRYSCFTFEASNTTYGANFGTAKDVENGKAAFTKESYLDLFNSEYYARSFYNPEDAEKFKSKFVHTDGNGNEYAYDETLEDVYAGSMRYMQSQVWYVLKKSLEDGIDYLDKCQYEFSQIDEPWAFSKQTELVSCMTLFRAAIIDLARKIDTESIPSLVIGGKAVKLDFENGKLSREEIIDSVYDFKTIVTANYAEMYDGIVEKWVPTTGYYHSEYGREKYYGKQTEKWWYTVDEAPGVSYSTELSPLYARVPGWMMADYDLTGILYWGGAIYYDVLDGTRQVEEYFKTNYYRYTNFNGNGYLMYPGGQYGLSEAIPSIRLEAIRDGFEEYELLYNVKQIYSEISESIGEPFDASKIIESFGSSLYAGGKISSDADAFDLARASLLQLASCAESAANMCVVDYSDNGYGEYNFKIYMNDGVTLYNGGKEVTDVYKSLSGGKIFEISVKAENASNMLDLSFIVGGEEYRYAQNLGGKATVYDAKDLQTSDFKKSTDIDFAAEQVDCATENVYAELGGKAIKLTVGASKEKREEDKLQYFKFESGLFEKSLSNAKRIVIHIHNASDEIINLNLEYKLKGSDTLKSLLVTILEKGENTLVLALPENAADVEYFDFGVGEKSAAETVKTLYFKDIVVYE